MICSLTFIYLRVEQDVPPQYIGNPLFFRWPFNSNVNDFGSIKKRNGRDFKETNSFHADQKVCKIHHIRFFFPFKMWISAVTYHLAASFKEFYTPSTGKNKASRENPEVNKSLIVQKQFQSRKWITAHQWAKKEKFHVTENRKEK